MCMNVLCGIAMMIGEDDLLYFAGESAHWQFESRFGSGNSRDQEDIRFFV